MTGLHAIELSSRRAWLRTVELDLADRLERRFGAHERVRYASDPVRQRLSHALTRVRIELSQLDEALRDDRAAPTRRA